MPPWRVETAGMTVMRSGLEIHHGGKTPAVPSLVQRIQAPCRSGKIHARGIELEEGIDEILFGSGQVREAIGQFNLASRSHHGITFLRSA